MSSIEKFWWFCLGVIGLLFMILLVPQGQTTLNPTTTAIVKNAN